MSGDKKNLYTFYFQYDRGDEIKLSSFSIWDTDRLSAQKKAWGQLREFADMYNCEVFPVNWINPND